MQPLCTCLAHYIWYIMCYNLHTVLLTVTWCWKQQLNSWCPDEFLWSYSGAFFHHTKKTKKFHCDLVFRKSNDEIVQWCCIVIHSLLLVTTCVYHIEACNTWLVGKHYTESGLSKWQVFSIYKLNLIWLLTIVWWL